MKKTLLILPALLLISLASCNGNTATSEVIGHKDPIAKYTYQGTHDFDVEVTDEFIVKNKSSDYKIVIPNNPSTQIINAKEELRNLFYEATGVMLDTITEDAGGMTHSETGKYFSLGDTKMLLSTGISIDKAALGPESVRIVTKDKTVYLSGGDDLGVVYAVYDMLEVFFNFDACSYNCVHLDKKDNLNFYKMDVTDIPDIMSRSNSWASIKENPNNIASRLRTPYDFSDYFVLLGDTSVPGIVPGAIHNSLSIIPKQSTLGLLYQDYWFSDTGGKEQICYTTHGDEDAYNALVNQTVEIIKQGLMKYTPEKYPMKNYMSFTMMDNSDTCHCDACEAAYRKYGTESGAVIVFCNKVMEKISAWMKDPLNAEYRRDELKLVFFAYNSFISSPAHWDEEANKYVINHPDLQMRDDVGVYYAVSSGLNYQKNIYDPSCALGLQMLRQWTDIAPSTLLWTYNANFGDYLTHIDSSNFYNNDAYQAFANSGVKLLYNQGAWNSNNLTTFQMLSIYLDAKLSWNSNYDMNELTNRYFNYMFGSAASEMKELYEKEQLHAMVMHEKSGVLANTGIINKAVKTRDYYSFMTLKNWLDILDRAYKKIEPYKETDLEKYMLLKEHIDLEWVSPAYLAVSIYGSDYFSPEEYNRIINYFVSEILPLKDFKLTERGSFLSVWISERLSGN